MKSIRNLVVPFASILSVFAVGVSPAAEQPLRFVHALQENGYGDMAVEYLKLLKDRPDLPPEVREVWDLEMSRSLKLAAADAFDAREHEALMDQSQKHLAAFIKERPHHPDAMVAMAAWGDFIMKRALESLRLAKKAEGKDEEQYAKHLSDARAGLTDAQDKFRQAEQTFNSRLAALPPVKPSSKKADRSEAAEMRERLDAYLFESQFQIALLDYYLAQTDFDPNGVERAAALRKAAHAFDDLYQRNRGVVRGLYPHMWHGKTAEELGELQLALDIYDEVLAHAPEPSEKSPSTGLEPLFMQVERFRLAIVAKRKPDRFLAEANAWLKDHRRLCQTDGYQGIAFDTAKATLDAADRAKGPAKTKLMSAALQIATEGSKVRSQYQQDLYAMRRDILKNIGRNLEINTFDDAVVAADAAAAGAEWLRAIDAYNKALEIAEKTKFNNPGRIDAVREAIDRVRFMMARGLFGEGKLSECIDTAGKIVYDSDGNVKRQSAAAAQASALGVAAALNLYIAAPDDQKAAALARLIKVAEFTEKNWPDRPEADDARMARGQAKLAVGQVPEAIDIFDRVNPKSERHATAMYWAGQSYWRLYLTEKLKTEGVPEGNRMAANRAKAVQCLNASLATSKKQFGPGRPMPGQMLEAQLLLAEICYEEGDAQRAASLLQPLVEALRAERPQDFDAGTIRVFLGAVRAYCDLNDIDRAGEAGAVLIELGPDTLAVNDALVDLAGLLNEERKKADARMTELENSANAGEVEAAKHRLASVEKLLNKMLVDLSRRKQLGLGHTILIGRTLNAVGLNDRASEQFQKTLERIEDDPEFAKQARGAMGLIRTELLKALRKQEKYGSSD